MSAARLQWCPLTLLRTGALLVLSACQTLPHVPVATLAELKAKGGYLKGAPNGLHRPRILNDVDFVYDAQWSPGSDRIALSRLGARSFDLFVWALDNPAPIFEAAINRHEFDVESVGFSEDGKWVGAVSRDGTVRIFDAATGKPAGGFLTEEPLVSIAFHPSGRFLAVGSEKGTVTLVKTAGFVFANEARVHQGAVRGLAFAADGRLFTAGWDKTLAVLTTGDAVAANDIAAVRFERKSGFAQVRGTLNGAASVLFALDVRTPQVLVLRSALAVALGLDPSTLTDTASITSSFGPQVARVAHGVRLAFKGLALLNLDAVVCDACIPADAQAVLGQAFSDAIAVSFDDALGQAVLERRSPVGAGQPQPSLNVLARFTFPAFLNDVSVDRAGNVLGVAFSESKAERSPEVYQREQRHEVEPERAWDVGARLDARTGAVLQTFHGHRGVVSTAAISPDGATLVTGGWDKRLLFHLASGPPREETFGGTLRRVRFSPDGRWLAAAAWTPQNPIGSGKTDPSALVFEVAYVAADVIPP